MYEILGTRSQFQRIGSCPLISVPEFQASNTLFLRPEREYKIIGRREHETRSPISPPLLL